jgi:F0F1-type ATP synthase delta subunit
VAILTENFVIFLVKKMHTYSHKKVTLKQNKIFIEKIFNYQSNILIHNLINLMIDNEL